MGGAGGEGNTLIHFSWRLAAAESTGEKTKRRSGQDEGLFFFFNLWPKKLIPPCFFSDTFAESHLRWRVSHFQDLFLSFPVGGVWNICCFKVLLPGR